MLNYRKPKKARLIFSVTAAVTICVLAISISAAMIHPIETYAENTGIGGNVQANTATVGTKQSGTEQDNISKEDEEISMVWPVPDSKIINAGYGKRVHPILKKETVHTGIDIAGKTGAPIVAAEGGNVITAEWKDDYGYFLIIKHSGGITTFYSHCSKLLVKKGDEVAAGQNIANIGSTGVATGPHLHFEVSKDGKIQNPIDYVSLPNSN